MFMNIQQYYQDTAQASLNGSLLACIPACLLIIYHSAFHSISGLLFWCVPFLLYSFMTYQNYMITSNRAKAITLVNTTSAQVDLFSQRELLLGFLPAPNVRMLLFHYHGQSLAEIRDLTFHKWRWFLPSFVDQWLYRNRFALVVNQQVVAIITLQRYDILIEYNGKIMELRKVGNKRLLCLENGQVYTLQYARTFMNLSIQFENGKELARLQRGWVPREWMALSKESNQPFLTINQTLTTEEQLILYSILMMYVKNVQH